MGRKGLKRTTPKQTSSLPMYVSYIRSKKMLHNDNKKQTIQYLFLMGRFSPKNLTNFVEVFPGKACAFCQAYQAENMAPPGFLCTMWPTLPVLGTGPFNVRILVVALLMADGWSTYFYPQKTQDCNSKPYL